MCGSMDAGLFVDRNILSHARFAEREIDFR